MAFAASLLPPVFAPLRSLFTSPRLPKARRHAAVPVVHETIAVPKAVTAAARPLRVLRVVEPQRGGAGRMVISGRMADVCAELDRLAALENAPRPRAGQAAAPTR